VYVFGGSWGAESFVVGLLILNLGISITNSKALTALGSNHNHLNNQFQSLAKDFKEVRDKVTNLDHRVSRLEDGMLEIKRDIKKIMSHVSP
jgi:peptidoglycan hydrolase CwlO-like protein